MSKENPTRVMLKNARLAFPNLFEPQKNDEGADRYTASFIIPPDHPQVKEIKAAIKAAAEIKWPKDHTKRLEKLEKTDKICLRDGDLKDQYDGFEGNLYVAAAAREDSPPTVVDADRTRLTGKEGRIYAGCYVNASLDFWAQDNAYGQRINSQIRGVQFVRDGDAFSAGRPADAGEFEDVTDGADADDFGDDDDLA